jgi:hypothetical protein
MNLLDFNVQDHYTEVERWWEFWRWKGRVCAEALSDIGYVVEKNGILLCAGWLYTTNSLVACLNFITANPYAQKEDVSEGLDFLIECLSQRGLKEGKRIIMSTVNNKNLAKRLGRLGFLENGNNLTHYTRLKWLLEH